MKAFSTHILLSCLAGWALANASRHDLNQARSNEANLGDAPQDGYISFTGPAFPGGSNVTLLGTVEQIYQQLLELNPDYNPWEFQEYNDRMAEMGFSSQEAYEEAVAKRSAPRSSDSKQSLAKRDGFVCNPAGSRVSNFYSQCTEGVNYLFRLNGYCGAPAGPGGCSRVSCSNGCGIHLCNDNRFGIQVWCGNLGGDANNINEHCGYNDDEGRFRYVLGQVFRSAAPGWNTIVKAQSC